MDDGLANRARAVGLGDEAMDAGRQAQRKPGCARPFGRDRVSEGDGRTGEAGRGGVEGGEHACALRGFGGQRAERHQELHRRVRDEVGAGRGEPEGQVKRPGCSGGDRDVVKKERPLAASDQESLQCHWADEAGDRAVEKLPAVEIYGAEGDVGSLSSRIHHAKPETVAPALAVDPDADALRLPRERQGRLVALADEGGAALCHKGDRLAGRHIQAAGLAARAHLGGLHLHARIGAWRELHGSPALAPGEGLEVLDHELAAKDPTGLGCGSEAQENCPCVKRGVCHSAPDSTAPAPWRQPRLRRAQGI